MPHDNSNEKLRRPVTESVSKDVGLKKESYSLLTSPTTILKVYWRYITSTFGAKDDICCMPYASSVAQDKTAHRRSASLRSDCADALANLLRTLLKVGGMESGSSV